MGPPATIHMVRVLEDKPGPLVATTWTSDFDIDPPLLMSTIYICQFNACDADNPASSAERSVFTPSRPHRSYGFPFAGLLFNPVCQFFPCARISATRDGIAFPYRNLLVLSFSADRGRYPRSKPPTSDG